MRAMSDFDDKTVRRRYVCLGIFVLVGVMISIVIYGIVSAASHTDPVIDRTSITASESSDVLVHTTPHYSSVPTEAQVDEGVSAKIDEIRETATASESQSTEKPEQQHTEPESTSESLDSHDHSTTSEEPVTHTESPPK
jgi:hypothetical protein